jgi:hypothetical protein
MAIHAESRDHKLLISGSKVRVLVRPPNYRIRSVFVLAHRIAASGARGSRRKLGCDRGARLTAKDRRVGIQIRQSPRRVQGSGFLLPSSRSWGRLA